MTALHIEEVTDLRSLHDGAERQRLTIVRPESLGDPAMSCNYYRVAPGSRITLHKHLTKSELWFFTAGTGVMTLGDQTLAVRPGMAVLTPPDTPHALDNTGSEPLMFVNVASPPSRRDPATGQIIGTIELEG